METVAATPRPTWFKVVAVIALVWNLFGIVAFLMQAAMPEQMLASMPPEQRALYEAQPDWVLIAFGIAVFAGAVGSLLLVLGRRLAVPLLGLSLVAVVAQMGYVLFFTPTLSVMGAGAAAMPVLVTAIAAYLFWLARSAARRGWLR